MPVMNQEIFVEGRQIPIGQKLGKGGEGEVYSLNDGSGREFKFYTVNDVSQREAKIRAMVESNMAATTNLVAFPLSVASFPNGQFAGFLMNQVKNHKPLFELYSPGARKQNFPEADYRFLVRTATNVARAVSEVHKSGCVIGDINASGILVSTQASATLIDADSFQISDSDSRFLCAVGTPEYTPPELQGLRLTGIVRTQNHDAFGLAVVIFQLLFMGRHPFTGAYSKPDDMPTERAIREYRFAYSRLRNVEMKPPIGAPVLGDFSADIQAAFEDAFKPNARRPSAEQWVRLLEDLERSLKPCPNNPLHYFSSAATQCQWCRMEKALGILLFLPYYISGGVGGAEAAALSFNLYATWALIESIAIPTPQDIEPVVNNFECSPSADLEDSKADVSLNIAVGVSVVAVSGVLWFAVPDCWWLWLGAAIFALKKLSFREDQGSELYRKYAICQQRWAKAERVWRSRIGMKEIDQVKRTLRAARMGYEGLDDERQKRMREYKAKRPAKHLEAYLDRCLIANAKIKGIGPTKMSTLRSYGIESAADIDRDKILEVPGFGQKNCEPLIEWRIALEESFVFDDSIQSSIDIQAQRQVDQEMAFKSERMRKELLMGPQTLQKAVQKIRGSVKNADPMLQRIHAERLQLEADMEYLGLMPPPWAPNFATPGGMLPGWIDPQQILQQQRLLGKRKKRGARNASPAQAASNKRSSAKPQGKQNKSRPARPSIAPRNAPQTASGFAQDNAPRTVPNFAHVNESLVAPGSAPSNTSRSALRHESTVVSNTSQGRSNSDASGEPRRRYMPPDLSRTSQDAHLDQLWNVPQRRVQREQPPQTSLPPVQSNRTYEAPASPRRYGAQPPDLQAPMKQRLPKQFLPAPQQAERAKRSAPSSGSPNRSRERALVNYFGAKQISRGDALQKRGAIQKSGFDAQRSIALGQVEDTDSQTYRAMVSVDATTWAVKQSKCSCPAKQKCKHCVALLFELIRSNQL